MTNDPNESAEIVDTMITEAMLSIVGEVMSSATAYPIAASDIRKWAMALYYPAIPPKLYWDEDYAATTRWGGIVAPENFNPFTAAWMSKDPPPSVRPARHGGFEEALGIEPPEYRAVLQSKVTARYGRVRMRPGDVIRSTNRITSYYERQGRMGLQLYTVISAEFTNQDDQWVRTLDTEFVRYR